MIGHCGGGGLEDREAFRSEAWGNVGRIVRQAQWAKKKAVDY